MSPIFLLLIAITVGGGALCARGDGPLATLGVMLVVLGGWAVSLCLHEFGHAFVAFRGGDTSVQNRGYLTLDIRRYLNPMLSFVLPVIFLLIGFVPLPGGAVWINDWAIRSRFARSMVSLAGPLINLLLGVALIVTIGSLKASGLLLPALACLAMIQVMAFVLNILPVPGLDGFGVIEPYLSARSRELADKVRPWAPLAFFALLLALAPLRNLLFAAGAGAFGALGGDLRLALHGYSEFTTWLS